MTKRTLKRVRNSINKHNRRVREKNATFEKMTKAEKRVQLAKDVLELIASGKIRPLSGTWLSKGGDDQQYSLAKGEVIDDDVQMNAFLPRIEQCNACAVGALLYCTVMRSNALTAGEIRNKDSVSGVYITDFEKIKSYLMKFFPESQLMKMEAAFERRGNATDQNDPPSQPVLAAGRMFMTLSRTSASRPYWLEDKIDDETRLVVIMQNVIENKGTFKPKKHNA